MKALEVSCYILLCSIECSGMSLFLSTEVGMDTADYSWIVYSHLVIANQLELSQNILAVTNGSSLHAVNKDEDCYFLQAKADDFSCPIPSASNRET